MSEIKKMTFDEELDWWRETFRLARQERPQLPWSFEERAIAEIDRLRALLAEREIPRR